MAQAPPFDGSEYRRTVLNVLRSAAPAGVDDLFWLGHVPRDTDDDALIAAQLKATKAFLFKERSRPRQADVAAAVLREWPRIEGVLGDPAARASLRARLGDGPPGAGVAGGGKIGDAAGAPAGVPDASAGADRRGRQVAAALGELARLREEPELAEDLFAFLGLPVTATREMLVTRVERVGEVNRRRRADRERSLVDELLMHCRELLIDGDPTAYRAQLAGETPAPAVDIPESFVAEDGSVVPVSPPPWNGPPPQESPPKIDYQRRPRPKPPELESVAEPDGPAPAVMGLTLRREGQGGLRVTWQWPVGVTEVVVATGTQGGPDTPGVGRKVTNAKYEIDGGVRLDGVPPGETVSVHTGRRDAAGAMHWNAPRFAARGLAP